MKDANTRESKRNQDVEKKIIDFGYNTIFADTRMTSPPTPVSLHCTDIRLAPLAAGGVYK